MSSVKVSGSATGTANFTIIAPSGTSTDRTLTLPDEAGTVLTSASDVAASQIVNALNATGSAPVYACRAWVNFNGTGTVAIRESGNVSSITDNGTGLYTVNFTTAMPDANYAASVSAGNVYNSSAGESIGFFGSGTASSIQVRSSNVTTMYDVAYVRVAIFR